MTMIKATLPLGSVAFEPDVAKGQRRLWLERVRADKFGAMCGPGESPSDVIIRLARSDTSHWVLTRKPRPISYSSLGECGKVNTAWIDRPVDARGLHSCFHVLLGAAW
jgi:hypothetical protein